MFALRRAHITRHGAAAAGAALAAAAGGCYALASARCEPAAPSNSATSTALGPGVQAVMDRLGPYVVDVAAAEKRGELVRRAVLQDVTIYALADEAPRRSKGGLPTSRIAQTVIKAPVEQVAALWWAVQARKDWDSVNTEDCRLVKTLGDSQKLVYLQGKPKRGGIVSSRDFCYVMHRVPSQALHAPRGSALFVQTNSAEEVPTAGSCVRADVHSLLLLEPLDASTTRASYGIEVDVKGWLPTKVVNAAADETPLTLAVMRDYLQSE